MFAQSSSCFAFSYMDTSSQGVFLPGSTLSWTVNPAHHSGTSFTYTITDGFENVITSGNTTLNAKVTYKPTDTGYYQLNVIENGSTIQLSSAAIIPVPANWSIGRTPFGLGENQFDQTWDARYGFGFERTCYINVLTASFSTLPTAAEVTGTNSMYQAAWAAKVLNPWNLTKPVPYYTTAGLPPMANNWFEVWNEPENAINNGQGGWTYADDFVPMCKATWNGVHQSSPSIKIAANMIWPNTADAFFAAGGGNYVDIITWHPYASWPNPNSISFEDGPSFTGTMWATGDPLGDLKEMIDHSGGKEVRVTEFGWLTDWPSYGSNTTHLNQAQWIVRAALLYLAAGFTAVEPYKIADVPFWNNLNGQFGLNFGDPNSGNPIAPKPAMVAYSMLAQTIDNLPYVGNFSTPGSNFPILLFGNSTRSVLVFWSSTGSASLSIANLPSNVSEMDLFGKTKSVASGAYSKLAGLAPVYLVFNTTPASSIAGILGKTLVTGHATGIFKGQYGKPVITTAKNASATVGSAFSYMIGASSSPISFNATGLPNGLHVNTVSGLISGTPTASGSFNVSLSASNAMGIGTATLALTVSLAGVPAAATQWWDTSANAGLNGGDGTWSTGDAFWAGSASPGTAAPGPWTNGNHAVFAANDAASRVTVINVGAAGLSITGNKPVTLLDGGAGPLLVGGAFTNTGAAATFDVPVALGGDQTWHMTQPTTLNGPVTGAHTLTKSGTGRLTLSNTGNRLAGLAVKEGPAQALNGGDALGGAAASLVLGHAGQSALAVLTLNAAAQTMTTYAMGDLTVAGAGQLLLNTAATTCTNLLAAGNLTRAPACGATLIVTPQRGLAATEQVTFTGGAITPVNGMLGPWLLDSRGPLFVTCGAAGLADAAFDAKTTSGEPWDATKKVHVNSATTLADNASVYAMRVGGGTGQNLTVPAGVTLNNASGGFILAPSGDILGNGRIDTGSAEILVYSGNARIIAPQLDSSGGLTTFGAGSLTISNMTYSGDTWIDQTTLTVAPATAQTYTNNINGILSTLGVGGTGSLTFNSSTVNVKTLTILNSGVALTATNAKLTTASGVSVGSAGITTVNVAFSGSQACWNGGGNPMYVGNGATTGNTMRVEQGAVMTNFSFFGVGVNGSAGVISFQNTATIAGGGQVWDRNMNAFSGVGGPGNSNKLTIVGGNGLAQPSLLYKATPLCIGSGAATGNVVIVDGGGVAGSAVVTNGVSYHALFVGIDAAGGNNGAPYGAPFDNRLIVTNGGSVFSIYQTMTIGLSQNGFAANSNQVIVVGSNSLLRCGTYTLQIGLARTSAGSMAAGNVLRVADGGTVDNGARDIYIGNAGNGATCMDNELHVANGGVVTNTANIYVGRLISAATARSNRIVLGAGGTVAATAVTVGQDGVTNNTIELRGGVLRTGTLTLNAANGLAPVVGRDAPRPVKVTGKATFADGSLVSPRLEAGGRWGDYTILEAGSIVNNGLRLDPAVDPRCWRLEIDATTVTLRCRPASTVLFLR
jgi:hypothetical protein